MSRRIGWVAMAMAGFTGLFAVAGCQSKTKEVKIGVVLPMSASGEMSGYARDILNGVYMGLDAVNAKVQNSNIRIIEKDYGGDPTKLDEIIKQLEQEGVIAIIGPVSSTDVLAIKSTVNSLALPTFTPSATYNSVIEGSKYLWRVCASDNHIGQAAAHLVGPEGLGLEEVAIVEMDGDPYSQELAANFKGFCDIEKIPVAREVIKTKGGPICDEATVKDIMGSFKAPLEKTGVFVPLYYQDAAKVITAFRKAGYQGVIVGGDGWDSRKLPGLVGEHSGVCYYITHFFPGDPEAKDFVERYNAKYSEQPSSFSALGYETFMVIHTALSGAQSFSREALKDQMQFVSYQGVTGNIDFGKHYEPGARSTVVVKMEDGKLSFYKRFVLSPYKSVSRSEEGTKEGTTKKPDAGQEKSVVGKVVADTSKKVTDK